LLCDVALAQRPPIRAVTVSALLQHIRTDLTLLMRRWTPSRQRPEDTPALKQLVAAADSFVASSIWTPTLEEAASALEQLSHNSLDQALPVGLTLIQRYLAEPDWRNPKYLQGLDQLLRAWTYVAAWKDVSGPLGQTAISKARIVLNQMLDNPLSIRELSASVASGLYSDRNLRDAQRWCELACGAGPIPWLEGALNLAAGRIPEARQSFLSLLRQPGLSPDEVALHLGNYGLCQLRAGDSRDGLSHLKEAASLKHIAVNVRTRVFRILAEGYVEVGKWDEAIGAVSDCISISRAHALPGQLRKGRRLRRRIVSQLPAKTGTVPSRRYDRGRY
jgi:hypothetical protein